MALRILDKTKAPVYILDDYTDFYIDETLEYYVDKTLHFKVPHAAEAASYLVNEGYVQTETDRYVIKEITTRSSDGYDEVVAKLDLDEFEGTAKKTYAASLKVTIEAYLTDLIDDVGNGWTISNTVSKTRKRMEMKNASALEIIEEAMKVYRCEAEFDNLNKVLYIRPKVGTDKGAYFITDLNLTEIEQQFTSYDFYTRLIAYGKDDCTFANYNDGKHYVTNYTYSSKHKTCIWQDDSYEDTEADMRDMLEDATAKLADMATPYVSYTADILDLANISDDYDSYAYSIGDIITLIHPDMETRVQQRIVELRRYPDTPDKNTCTLANKVLTFDELTKKYDSSAEVVSNVTSSNGTVKGSTVDSIQSSQVSDFVTAANLAVEGTITAHIADVEKLIADTATIQTLKANDASIGSLIAKKATVDKLIANNATLDNLIATDADIDNLIADNAKITSLIADEATIKKLTSNRASIKKLIASSATVDKLIAKDATITSLVATDAEIDSLTANDATVTSLIASDAEIETLAAESATITSLVATTAEIETLVAESASITSLFATTAEIQTLSAESATITGLVATTAEIEMLAAENVTVTSLIGDTAELQDLIVTNGTVINLVSENARLINASIDDLDANFANINTILAGNAGVGSLQAITLTTSNTLIDDATIRTLIANHIAVEDLKAGTISTDKFTIASDDGGIVLSGNTQQFYDDAGTVRLQLGQDNSGQFTFVLYDPSGEGVLIDANGIHASAIGDGLIVDSMVAENAKIAGTKLDIETNSSIIQIRADLDGLGVNISQIEDVVDGIESPLNVIYNLTYVDNCLTNPNDQTVTVYAHVYRNGIEITEDYDDSWFRWRWKTETADSAYPGNGPSITVNKADFSYGGVVVGLFGPLENKRLAVSAGAITTEEGRLNAGSGVDALTIQQEVSIYQKNAIVSQFHNVQTTFNVLQGKVSSIISDEEVTQLQNEGVRLYTKVSAIEQTLDSITLAVGDFSSYSNQFSELIMTVNGISATVASNNTQANIIAQINDGVSSVKIRADNIALTGYVTVSDLTTAGSTTINGANITTGTITSIAINNGNGTFSVTSAGALTASSATITGTIRATAGYIGGSGGWQITTNRLYSGTYGSDNSLYLSTADLASLTVAYSVVSSPRLTIGSNFAVTSDGILYANRCVLNTIRVYGSSANSYCSIGDHFSVVNLDTSGTPAEFGVRINNRNGKSMALDGTFLSFYPRANFSGTPIELYYDDAYAIYDNVPALVISGPIVTSNVDVPGENVMRFRDSNGTVGIQIRGYTTPYIRVYDEDHTHYVTINYNTLVAAGFTSHTVS